jgi:hypothetical protein
LPYRKAVRTVTVVAGAAIVVAVAGNFGTAVAARDNCRRIDNLYDRVRMNAIRNYAELDEQGRLLGIKITPELRQRAREDRDRTVRQYAPLECSIWIWHR